LTQKYFLALCEVYLNLSITKAHIKKEDYYQILKAKSPLTSLLPSLTPLVFFQLRQEENWNMLSSYIPINTDGTWGRQKRNAKCEDGGGGEVIVLEITMESHKREVFKGWRELVSL